MHSRFIIGLVFVALLVVAFGMRVALTEHPTRYTALPTATVTVGSATVVAEVASTDFERHLGLSGRDALKEGGGMLFVFENEGPWGIWMKDMRFPLDVVWADSAGTVVGVAHDISPDTYPQVFYPSEPARYVLEVPAGFTAAHDIVEGAHMSIEYANAPR